MGKEILIFSVLLFVVKIQSQCCGASFPPPFVSQVAPQIVSTPAPIVTTIVDNSVSNTLANALQLLIFSNLLESTQTPISALNLGQIIEPCIPELFHPVQEYVTPCGNLEVVQPCIEGFPEGFRETIYSPSMVERITPNICGGVTETLSPLYNPIVETFASNSFGGLTETFSPLYGPVESYVSNCYGFTETIAPNFCGLTEVVTPGPYCNTVTEIISQTAPNLGPNCFGGLGAVPPAAQYIPSYYGGLAELVSGPVAAEVLFPADIPAQLKCNFGYSSTNTPCVSVNVEPLPFESGNNIFKNFMY